MAAQPRPVQVAAAIHVCSGLYYKYEMSVNVDMTAAIVMLSKCTLSHPPSSPALSLFVRLTAK